MESDTIQPGTHGFGDFSPNQWVERTIRSQITKTSRGVCVSLRSMVEQVAFSSAPLQPVVLVSFLSSGHKLDI